MVQLRIVYSVQPKEGLQCVDVDTPHGVQLCLAMYAASVADAPPPHATEFALTLVDVVGEFGRIPVPIPELRAGHCDYVVKMRDAALPRRTLRLARNTVQTLCALGLRETTFDAIEAAARDADSQSSANTSPCSDVVTSVPCTARGTRDDGSDSDDDVVLAPRRRAQHTALVCTDAVHDDAVDLVPVHDDGAISRNGATVTRHSTQTDATPTELFDGSHAAARGGRDSGSCGGSASPRTDSDSDSDATAPEEPYTDSAELGVYTLALPVSRADGVHGTPQDESTDSDTDSAADSDTDSDTDSDADSDTDSDATLPEEPYAVQDDGAQTPSGTVDALDGASRMYAMTYLHAVQILGRASLHGVTHTPYTTPNGIVLAWTHVQRVFDAYVCATRVPDVVARLMIVRDDAVCAAYRDVFPCLFTLNTTTVSPPTCLQYLACTHTGNNTKQEVFERCVHTLCSAYDTKQVELKVLANDARIVVRATTPWCV